MDILLETKLAELQRDYIAGQDTINDMQAALARNQVTLERLKGSITTLEKLIAQMREINQGVKL